MVDANTLKEFESWLILERDLKKSSTKSHVSYIKLLNQSGVDILNWDSFEQYIVRNRERFSSSHLNNSICTARVFNQFCQATYRPYSDAILTFRFFKDKYRPKATMSDEEIEAFLALPPIRNESREAHRYWTVFFSILAYTGMRPGEVAGLKVNDIDFGRNIIVLPDSKTNEPRFIPIATSLEPILKAWIDKIEDGYLFKSKRPEGHTSSVEWGYGFHTRIQKLGIRRSNLTPYSFRHSLITRLLEEDQNIFKIQKIVGHHDIRTTLHYSHLTTKDIVATINKHPLVRKHTNPRHILSYIQSFIETMDFGSDRRFETNLTRGKYDLSFKITVKEPAEP